MNSRTSVRKSESRSNQTNEFASRDYVAQSLSEPRGVAAPTPRRSSYSGTVDIVRKALSLTLSASLLLPALVCLPASAESVNAPAGTLLLPLTPKIDTSFDEDEPEQPSTAREDSARIKTVAPPSDELPYSPDAGAEAVAAADPVLDAEIEVDENAEAVDAAPLTDALTGMPLLQAGSDVETEVGEDTTLKGTIQIVADDTEFDQENNTFLGSGNAVAIIGGQNSKLEADMILYNQTDDMIDARGNVRIIRDGQVTTGSAFKFKVTSDEYLLTNPDTEINGTTVVARIAKGTDQGLLFKEGDLGLPDPIYISRNTAFGPGGYTEEMRRKMVHPDAYLPAKPSFKFKARKMVYEKYKDAGNLTVFGGRMMFGKFGVPVPKFSATINQNENNVVFPVTPNMGNNLQIGGMHIGPKFNYAVGKTGTLSWSPMVQIGGRNLNGSTNEDQSNIGLSGRASYSNSRLQTNIATGSVNNLLVADLKYRINKNDRFQSGINRFIEDGMFGWRRARIQGEVVDQRGTGRIPFLTHMNFRSSAGWYQDNPQLVNLNPEYAELFGGNQSSTKVFNSAFKLQEQITAATHPIFNIGDDKVGIRGNLMGGVAMRAYSSGEMNLLGQVGPNLDVRLNKARFQVNYMQSAVRGDESPFVFDRFIQGQRSVGFNGDVKVSKYLTLGGGLGYNMNNKLFYSKSMTAAIGPEDFKVLLTRDMIRGINRVGFDVLYGAPVQFNKLVLKGAADHGQLGGI